MTSMASEVVCMMPYLRAEALMKLTSCHLQTVCVELVFRGLVLSPLRAGVEPSERALGNEMVIKSGCIRQEKGRFC